MVVSSGTPPSQLPNIKKNSDGGVRPRENREGSAIRAGVERKERGVRDQVEGRHRFLQSEIYKVG